MKFEAAEIIEAAEVMEAGIVKDGDGEIIAVDEFPLITAR